MATYLLTWNPKRWDWEDLQENIAELTARGSYNGRWSCGNTKKIQPGDRIFLIKLGTEPRGIMASGRARSAPFEAEHWDPQKRAQGKLALYIDVQFDTILDPEIEVFPRAWLTQGIYTQMHWTPQSSGPTIPVDLAAQLEADWATFLGSAPEPDLEPLTEQVEPTAIHRGGHAWRAHLG